MSTVKPIPEGFRTVTPYLICDRAAEVIDFLKRAFGAQVSFQMMNPDGSIGHSEIRIGDSMIMLSSAREQWKAMPAMIHMYVDNVDAWYAKAIEAGAETVMPVADQFYGDRSGGVKDIAGNYWWMATHVKDISEEEMKRLHSQKSGQ